MLAKREAELTLQGVKLRETFLVVRLRLLKATRDHKSIKTGSKASWRNCDLPMAAVMRAPKKKIFLMLYC